jgi:NAD(P)-dependent dehydrogenase (short-subunit alcohol dehydrogenase family)
VTGAASGIGRGLCEQLAADGVRVVAADVDADALDRVVSRLAAGGAQITGIPTDVSDRGAVDALARRVLAEHDDVRLVFANAGVFVGGALWEVTDDDWAWALGVNVLGIAHMIQAFVPPLLARGTDGHIVITASLAGLISAPLAGVYCTTKFAAVALAESLHHDLSLQPDCRLRAACVVPGSVDTAIATSARNRPDGAPPTTTPTATLAVDALAASTAAGIDPREAARRILAGLRAGDFYVPTGESFDRLVTAHNATRLARAAPELLMYD